MLSCKGAFVNFRKAIESMPELWNAIAKQGAFGLALVACMVIITSLNETQKKEYEMRLEQSRQERQELVQVIRDNTTASEKLADTIEKMLQRL